MTDQPADPNKKQKTEYIILRFDPVFRPLVGDPITGASNLLNSDGTYVAVPARSWQPVTITTRTETRLTLNPAN